MSKDTLPGAEPTGLSQFIEYADSSIVSKTLINRTACTLTLFAFDQGQSLSEHTAPFDAVVQVLDGSCELTIGGNPVFVQAGQVVLMPADVPHSVRATARFKMLLTMVRG